MWRQRTVQINTGFHQLDPVLYLTHWGLVTYICVNKLTTIGSGNSLSPGRHQAIIWPNTGILLIAPLWTNFSEILIEIHTFSFKKMHLKISWGKCGHLSRLQYVKTDQKPIEKYIQIFIRELTWAAIKTLAHSTRYFIDLIRHTLDYSGDNYKEMRMWIIPSCTYESVNAIEFGKIIIQPGLICMWWS